MSFDPLTIILLLLFVVGPLLGRLFRGKSPQGPPPKMPRPGQTPTTPTRKQSPETASTANRETSSNGGAFEKRLEQARRRVQAAMDGTTSAASEAKVPQTPSTPRPTPNAGRFGDKNVYERRLPNQNSAELSRKRRQERQASERAKTRDPVTLPVQRHRPQKPAKLAGSHSRGPLLQFDRHSISQGIIWHQILSDPLVKRKARRKPSRHP